MLWVMKITVLRSRCQSSKQFFLQKLAGLGVDGAERFVHKQDRGIDRQRAGQSGALLHAAGELVRIMIFEIGQTDALQIVARGFCSFFFRQIGAARG